MVTGGIIRAVARPLISSLVKREFRPKSIVRELRSMGYGYRYQNMLNDIREFTHFHKQWGWASRISSIKPPSLESIPSVFFDKPRKFRGYLTVTKENVRTGDTSEDTISFYSNDLLSPDQWVSDVLDQEEEDPSDPSVKITSARLTDVIRNTQIL
jgi:hypothetical protein